MLALAEGFFDGLWVCVVALTRSASGGRANCWVVAD